MKYAYTIDLRWAIKGIYGRFCQTCQTHFLDFTHVLFSMGVLDLTQKRAISEGKRVKREGGINEVQKANHDCE